MSSLFGIGAGGETEFYSFKINQSLRFTEGSQAYLRKTDFSGSATSEQTGTFSVWVKNTLSFTDNRNAIYGSSTGSSAFVSLSLSGDSQNIDLRTRNGSGTDVIDLITDTAHRDPSAWYHIMSVYDLTSSTQSDRAQIYVNGVRVTSFGTETLPSNTTTEYDRGDFLTDMQIGRTNTNSSNMLYADFILAEYHRVDGQALDPTSFGQFKSGVWTPKEYTGTYGNHGFHLDFADTSDIGKDVSGNGNDFTANNLSTHDVLLDSPTNNFPTLSSIDSNTNLSEGNLKYAQGSGAGYKANSTFVIEDIADSQKYYVEYVSDSGYINGIIPAHTTGANNNTVRTGHLGYYPNTGQKYNGSSASSYGATHGTSNQMAMLIGDGQIEFFKDNASQGVAFTGLTGSYKIMSGAFGSSGAGVIYNFGADSSFVGAKTAQNNTDANGLGDFFYAPPSGALALCSSNLPEPRITPLKDDIPEDYFEANLWTGNGSSQSISSYEFAPDWVWIKERTNTSSHYLVDTVRGASLFMQTNSTVGDTSNTTNVTSFDSNGFSLGSGGTTNQSSQTYVGWAWLAGTAFSNDASATGVGTIDSTGQVNTEAGFAIISHTGTGSAGTIAHGLGKKPAWIMTKLRSEDGDGWLVYHHGLNEGATPEQKYVVMSSTSGIQDNSIIWNDTAPTTSVFSVGTSNAVNGNTETYISYVFSEIEGYSKFGFYTGNGSTNGVFVYTGFKPALLIVKQTDASNRWIIVDNKRGSQKEADTTVINNNPLEEKLELNPNDDSKESTSGTDCFDFLSNGFKLRRSGDVYNGSGHDYIFMAFAEMPFKYANPR